MIGLNQSKLLSIVGTGANVAKINKIAQVKNPNSYVIVLRHVDEQGNAKQVAISAFGSTTIFNGRRVFGNWIANTNSLFTPTGTQRTTIPISVTLVE